MSPSCPMCGHVFAVKDEFASDGLVCPSCGTVVREGFAPTPRSLAIDRSFAEERVAAPAICLMLVGGLAMLGGFFQLAGVAAVLLIEEESDTPEKRAATAVFYAVSAIYSLAVGGLMLFGGLKMKRLESWGFAMTAAILAVIPCNVCCMFGMPVGIWSLVPLNDPQVKGAFR